MDVAGKRPRFQARRQQLPALKSYLEHWVSMEIVSFCRIIPLCNFQYRKHVHSITLISIQITSQNLEQI